MLSTKQVILALRGANPDASITEDRIRHVLRRGAIEPPPQFAGRYQWTPDAVRALANELGLVAPSSRRGAASEVHEERVGAARNNNAPRRQFPIKESRHGAGGNYGDTVYRTARVTSSRAGRNRSRRQALSAASQRHGASRSCGS